MVFDESSLELAVGDVQYAWAVIVKPSSIGNPPLPDSDRLSVWKELHYSLWRRLPIQLRRESGFYMHLLTRTKPAFRRTSYQLMRRSDPHDLSPESPYIPRFILDCRTGD